VNWLKPSQVLDARLFKMGVEGDVRGEPTV